MTKEDIAKILYCTFLGACIGLIVFMVGLVIYATVLDYSVWLTNHPEYVIAAGIGAFLGALLAWADVTT